MLCGRSSRASARRCGCRTPSLRRWQLSSCVWLHACHHVFITGSLWSHVPALPSVFRGVARRCKEGMLRFTRFPFLSPKSPCLCVFGTQQTHFHFFYFFPPLVAGSKANVTWIVR